MVEGGAAVGLLGRGVGKSGSLCVSGILVAVPSMVDWQAASEAVQATASAPVRASRVFIAFSLRRLW